MSAAPDEPTRLTDEDVISYLRLDPNFFQRHAGLLSELNLPHESGAAVSLVERQVAILRERNMQMRRRMNDLVQAATDNESLFQKIRALTLALLQVDGWHALNEILATHVLADFHADFVCCHIGDFGIRLDHLQSHPGALPNERHMGKDPVCATLRAEELSALFPAQRHEQEGSAVLASLSLPDPGGCLALGSRDPGYFRPDMDTLFVAYVAEVLTRVVDRLIRDVVRR